MILNQLGGAQRRRSRVRSCQRDINTSIKAGTCMRPGPGPLRSLTFILGAFLPCNPYFESPLLLRELDLLVAATRVYRSHCDPLLVILKLSGGLLDREICRYGSTVLAPFGIILAELSISCGLALLSTYTYGEILGHWTTSLLTLVNVDR
jgi:hypothetical protein